MRELTLQETEAVQGGFFLCAFIGAVVAAIIVNLLD